MAINFNNQNQGIGTLDLSQFGLMQPQNQNMQVADAYNTPTEGEYGFNLIQLDRLKNAGYDPAELSTYPNQEDVQSIIRNLEPTANANNIMTDANVGTPSSIIEDGQRNQFPGISVGPMSNVERDFPGMSTGDIIDSMQDKEYVGPSYEKNFDYLGAGSPMLSKGSQTLSQTPTDPEMSYPYTTGRGNARLSSEKNYDYDPAFGDLVNYTSGPTSFTDRNTFMRDGKLQLSNSGTQGYFDDYERIPSLQRALGNERFALAPEELTSQPQELGYVKPAAVPKEAIYQDRIMNRNLSNSNYEPRQGILQGLQDKIGAGFNNVKDFAIDKGRMGKNLIGAGAAKFAGLPGMVGSGLMSLLSNLGNGVDYQQYTPGFDYNGLNNSMINDFYDPATGLNRFDRARRKGNTFASARTGAEYFKLRREKKAQDKINAAAATKAAEAAARGNYTPGGSHLSRGTSGGGLGLSQAQAQSVSQANKDAGYSSFSGLKDGGLASMFTRRR